MITKEFAEAATEINAILGYLPSEYVDKIPEKLRNFLKKVESKEYTHKIDPYKRLNEQELLPKTRTLLTVLYREYWCTDEERAELDKKLIENDRKERLAYYQKLAEEENW